ncbi:oligopeptide transporter 4 [Nicotiana attenuata]|uniref:Oligopeptide transporter 4 n=1 Tax=Nicotiana attenuata TaxID=49451 RepID=A0A1J6IQK4_NICAT|nr:oligopeptide transporter 4 [Nicotiana attenuata]
MMLKNPSKIQQQFTIWISDLLGKKLLLILPPMFLIVYISFSSKISSFMNSWTATVINSGSLFLASFTKGELDRSRIAVCSVGGARSPLDFKACKLSLLKAAPRIAAVKIFRPQPYRKLSHNSEFSLLKTHLMAYRKTNSKDVPQSIWVHEHVTGRLFPQRLQTQPLHEDPT